MVQEPLTDATVCVVGLGYVGLPLAEAFSQHIRTIGFRRNKDEIQKINGKSGNKILATTDPSLIRQADFIAICVPTPVSKSKDPDLFHVRSAAETVGKNLKKGAVVVLESTVYPGVTEEVVRPILEQESGMQCGTDFKIGYSPERINPGDCVHCLGAITKVVAGMDEETTDILCRLYGLITDVYPAKDIKTAEAAKVIENIQRDLNIALMNELSLIFHRLGIDTGEVIDAACTKWNFNRFTPGLVGGHCIPVDPYYLVYKANELGYHPRVILAGRAINDSMPKYIAEMTLRGLNDAEKVIKHSKVVIMGITYKENVADVRESPVSDIVRELKSYGVDVYGHDPLLTADEIERFGLKPVSNPDIKADGIIIAVGHDDFRRYGIDEIRSWMNSNPIFIDVRGMYDRPEVEKRGFRYWKL